ncbi:MAG TPA: GntR family transcriptional regulator [Gaiellaceae bacterium]|nr:GntR family transcriptional regulator [Gaiellaceae bacterium]
MQQEGSLHGYGTGRSARFHPPNARGRFQRTNLADTARRVRDILRSNVTRGNYGGGVLPSEAELMATYNAPRAAVREALAMLKSEGLVDRVQGVGTVRVTSTLAMVIDEAHGTHPPRLGSILDSHTRPRILDSSVVPMPDAAAVRLECEPGSDALRLEYVSLLDGEPISLATNYLVYPEAEAVERAPFRTDWYALLGDAGLSIGHSEFAISCVNADERVAPLLDVEVGRALMLLEQVIWDDAGRPFNFAVIYGRGDRTQIISHMANG